MLVEKASSTCTLESMDVTPPSMKCSVKLYIAFNSLPRVSVYVIACFIFFFIYKILRNITFHKSQIYCPEAC